MWLQAGTHENKRIEEARLQTIAGSREQPSHAVEHAVEQPAASFAASAPEPEAAPSPGAPPPVLPAWKMGLLVTASALCGGIAVVLWNRRLLTKMREVEPVVHEDLQGRLWEDDL